MHGEIGCLLDIRHDDLLGIACERLRWYEIDEVFYDWGIHVSLWQHPRSSVTKVYGILRLYHDFHLCYSQRIRDICKRVLMI